MQTTIRRWPFFILGVLLFVLGPISAVVLFRMNGRMPVFQVPILATLGVLVMAASVWQRGGILRRLGLGLFLLLCGFEWFMLLVSIRTPQYAGPEIGRPMPVFATTFANGKAFTSDDLRHGKDTVLIFFRGHW